MAYNFTVDDILNDSGARNIHSRVRLSALHSVKTLMNVFRCWRSSSNNSCPQQGNGFRKMHLSGVSDTIMSEKVELNVT